MNKRLLSLILGLIILLVGSVAASAEEDVYVSIPVTTTVWQIAQNSLTSADTADKTADQVNLEVISRAKLICTASGLAVPAWKLKGPMDARKIPNKFAVLVPQRFVPAPANETGITESASEPQQALGPAPTLKSPTVSENWNSWHPIAWLLVVALVITIIVLFRRLTPLSTTEENQEQRVDDTVPVPDPIARPEVKLEPPWEPMNAMDPLDDAADVSQVQQRLHETALPMCPVLVRSNTGEQEKYALVSRGSSGHLVVRYKDEGYSRARRWEDRRNIFREEPTPARSSTVSSKQLSH